VRVVDITDLDVTAVRLTEPFRRVPHRPRSLNIMPYALHGAASWATRILDSINHHTHRFHSLDR